MQTVVFSTVIHTHVALPVNFAVLYTLLYSNIQQLMLVLFNYVCTVGSVLSYPHIHMYIRDTCLNAQPSKNTVVDGVYLRTSQETVMMIGTPVVIVIILESPVGGGGTVGVGR